MSRLRLGELLVQEGKIDQAQLQAGLAHHRRWGKKIGECLVQLGFIQELELCQTLAKSLRLPLVDVTKIDAGKVTKEILGHISVQIARSHRIIPIAIKEVRAKKRLIVATSDPTDFKIFDEIQFKSSLPVLVMIAPDSDIEWFIRKYYLSEADALPLNYVSGISIIDTDITDAQGGLDPISNIFFDSEFTGVNKAPASSSKSKPSDPKKDKT